MWHLYAKFKNEEWKEIDHTDSDTNEEDQEGQKKYLENEYRVCMGRSYMFKWVKAE